MSYYHDTLITIYENDGEDEIELPVRCHFDFQPGEQKTRDYPGCAAEASLHNITSKDKRFDFAKVSKETKSDLEKECYNSMFGDEYDDRD